MVVTLSVEAISKQTRTLDVPARRSAVIVTTTTTVQTKRQTLSRNDAGILVVVRGSPPGASRNLIDATARITGGTIALTTKVPNHDLPPVHQHLPARFSQTRTHGGIIPRTISTAIWLPLSEVTRKMRRSPKQRKH